MSGYVMHSVLTVLSVLTVVCSRNFFGAGVELLNSNVPAGVERPRTLLVDLLGDPTGWL